MSIIEITKKKLQSKEYEFLRTNPHLGDRVILLGFGGSVAYGTNNENSDIDIRGVTLNSTSDLIGMSNNFEQFVNETTDTTIYSLNKIVKLLINCNPNTCELLGLKPEHYLYLSPIGKELLDNKHLFLSKKCVYSFGGYANAQLRRLDNKAARLLSQTEQENHILKSIENAYYSFKDRFFTFDEDAIKLYIDKSEQEEFDSEILILNITL